MARAVPDGGGFVTKWLALTALISLIVVGCAATAERLGDRPISEGEKLYRANCRSCHTLRNPGRYTDEQWPPLVERYAGRINLSEESQQRIIEYLLSAN